MTVENHSPLPVPLWELGISPHDFESCALSSELSLSLGTRQVSPSLSVSALGVVTVENTHFPVSFSC